MTKSGKIISTLLIASLTGLAGCKKDNTGLQEMQTEHEEVVVVANKAGASITFINAKNDEVMKSLSIPGSEPMYVVFVPRYDKLYVGDRQQKKIHVINPATQLVEQSISVGNGVFHMWADAVGKALWVVNDADQTISVIDLASNTVVKTISLRSKKLWST
jgi:YVTN family beta-propeller protein